MSLLSIEGLKIHFFTLRGVVRAVDGVTLQLARGEALGLAGESGCGKTTLALSLLRLVPSPGRIVAGQILFDQKGILEMTEDQFREEIRWKKIALVFQGAMSALNPVMRVKDQVIETITTHDPDASVRDAAERTQKLLEAVGIDPSADARYPHELSGGMKQRIMMAMALSCDPEVLIADEPTTALDVIVQAQILELIRDLRTRLGLAMLIITHDLSTVAEVCSSVAIMYAGKLLEYADVDSFFANPGHPYSRGLLDALPDIKAERKRLSRIPGVVPDLISPPKGCRFSPRCPHAKDICSEQDPQLTRIGRNHIVACHFAEKLNLGVD